VPEQLPKKACGAAAIREKLSAGVVVEVATEVENKEPGPLAENDVTVPDPAPVAVTVTAPVPPEGDRLMPVPAMI
jgi:hypothetical protein